MLSEKFSQRWCHLENFSLNTKIHFTKLYGQEDPDWPLGHPIAEDIEFWESHVKKLGIHYRLNTTVTSVKRDPESKEFFVVTAQSVLDGVTSMTDFRARNVICANGRFGTPNVPKSLSASTPSSVKQHVVQDLKLDNLQPGAVLVVGSAQSGTQIADMLSRNGKKTFLCQSKVLGCPRSYRGRDLFYWLELVDFLFMPTSELGKMDPEKARWLRYGANPMFGSRKPISPFSLHRQGVTLLGHLDAIDDGVGKIRPDRALCCHISYAGYEDIMNMIVDFAKKKEETDPEWLAAFTGGAPHDLPEPEWEIVEELMTTNGPETIDFKENDITNIVWCTGWNTDFSFLEVAEATAEFDRKGYAPTPPKCESEAVPGLFFCGFPWLSNLNSENITGMSKDQLEILKRLR